MKKAMTILGSVSAIVVLMLAFASVVSADNGPHGNFGPRDTTSTTDSCAACHRAHTGTADNLLRWGSTQYQFCTTCHGPVGQGAVTDVVDGEIQAVGDGSGSTVRNPYGSIGVTSKQITAHDPLNGGGFEYMHMYVPAGDQVAAPATATSKHRVEGVDGSSGNVIAWGGGDNSSGPGIAGFLQCTSCHDPHGSPNYRILNPGYQNGAAYATSWTSRAAIWPAVYIPLAGQEPMVGSNEIATGPHNYASKLNVYYDYGISDFCGGCHQQYLINRANGLDAYNSYDALGTASNVARYRHPVTSKGYYTTLTQEWVTVTNGFRADAAAFASMYPFDTTGRALRRVTEYYGGSRTNSTFLTDTNGNYNGTMVTCLTCHYAHGSAAEATGWASRVAPTYDSANLYLNNRGVCQACHAKGADPGQY